MDEQVPEIELDSDQIRVEELLFYCQEQGVDDKINRFTEPDYYVENVQLSSIDNEKIKDMMQAVDYKVMQEELEGAVTSSDDDYVDTYPSSTHQ